MKNNRYSISMRHALMLLVLLLGFPSWGYTAESDHEVVYEGVRYRIDMSLKSAIVVGSSNKYIENVVIPSRIRYGSYNTYPVLDIGNYAFDRCTRLTSITIYNGVKIGNHAFSDCTSLTKVNIRPSIIGSEAFSGCTSLTSITIDNDVKIGSGAFKGCTSLTEVNIPYAKIIGDEAFSGCRGLTSVRIPKSVTSIGNATFSGCIYNHRTTKTNQKYPSVNL